MSKIDKLKKAKTLADADFERHVNNVDIVAERFEKIADIYDNAYYYLDEIDEAFKQQTGLTKNDIVFLFIATGLQVARQYILSNDTLKFQDEIKEDGSKGKSSSQKGDEFTQKIYDKTVGKIAPRDWKDILFQSVPYDALEKTVDFKDVNTGLSGANHRYRTLGHDPVLGWIFGTANIMTNSLTKTTVIDTYIVEEKKIAGLYPGGTLAMLEQTIQFSIEDIKLLLVCIVRQAIHFGSDYFTKQGLPVPFIATVNNDVAQKMIDDWHIDSWSITKGMVIASFIDQIISFIHRLFYNGETDLEYKLYQERTNKIVRYSNLIASTSNVLIVALTAEATGGSSLKYLDVGGILKTIKRLIEDHKFTAEIKREFMEKNWIELINPQDVILN